MSTATVPRRHALGLPAGSVRAIHVLLIVGLTCALIVYPSEQPIAFPPYLLYLLFLMLGHYFGARGVAGAERDASQPKPLYLPGGTVRLLVIAALAGVIAWKYVQVPDIFLRQFDLTVEQIGKQPLVPVLVLGGFFLGVIMRGIVGRANPPQAWQDFEAWVSLLAVVGLCAAAVIHLVIDPSLQAPGLSWPMWEGILGAVVAFYFGARS
jgi:hypothetical protein